MYSIFIALSFFLAIQTHASELQEERSTGPTPENAPSIAEESETPLTTPVDINSAALSPTEAISSATQNTKEQLITLSLEDCTRLALEGATAVLKAQNDVSFSGTQLLQGYAQFLPTLDTQVTYSVMRGNDYLTFATPTLVNSDTLNLSYLITSRFNIFSAFSDFSNLKSAILKKDAADLTLTRAKQQIVLDIAQSYLQVVLDNEIVIIAKKNLSLSQERETLLSEQTRVGVRNLADLFRQQAQTSADELFLMNSLNKERSDQILLLRKLRQDVSKNYKILPPKIEEGKRNPELSDENKLIEIGLQNRTDLKASQSLSDAGEWDVTHYKSAYYPRLDFIFTGNSNGTLLQRQLVNGINQLPSTQFDLFNQLGKQFYYTAGLTLTFNIFDGWITRLTVAQARKTADNLSIDAVDRRLQVEGEIRQTFGDYQTGLQLLESTKKGLISAQKAYEVTQGRYDVGAASFVDLITAQTSLVQAESNRAQAMIGFLLQEKTMDFVLGKSNINTQ